MKQGELHLFILWERGQSQKERISTDIEKNFSLLKVVDVLWNPQYFHQNLSRFYGKKLKKSYKKDKIIGTGRFTVFIVCDEDAASHTAHGKNSKMLEFKIKYRRWLGDNLLHASDSALEAKENLLFLFHMSDEELRTNYMKLPALYNQGALAEKGFETQKSFESTLNRLPFEVQCLGNNIYHSKYPQMMERLLNANPRKWLFISRKGKYKVKIAKQYINIQLI